MIISTPKIDDMSDANTLTMANTLANAQIVADFSHKKTNAADSASLASSSSNTTPTVCENTAQPRKSPRRPSVNGFIGRVGFDTFGSNDTAEYAFTVRAKTDNWKRTKKSRTFLVGTDLNDYSAHALQWVMENMVEDGDEIVALRVVPVELRDSLSKTGIPSFQGQEESARSGANKIMNSIREHNVSGREINIVVECMVGNVRETIQHMIKLYQPDMLVVGTRGRNPVKGFLLGSVSRYCLHHSPVPCIVVRPERKLNKSKTKAKGIFRRRSSSVMSDEDEGYQPHPTQPIHMSTSDFDIRNSLTYNSGSTLSPRTSLFPSATVHAGDKFPGLRVVPNQAVRPLSSLFTPVPSATASISIQSSTTSSTAPTSTPSSSTSTLTSTSSSSTPASNAASSGTTSSTSPTSRTSITLLPTQARSSAPPPPEGMIKMKKSLTIDGSSKSSKSFGRPTSGFLSGSTLLGPLLNRGDKDKDKDKEKDKSKKRFSQGA
ncbi:hypothetical protein BGX34_006941 [Mortierella sp. NVP85]|nr:hypothetical protein BGX34_006941 [Mortierella sp. NVP85]